MAGPDHLSGLFLPAAAFTGLQAGQIIDVDDVTGARISVIFAGVLNKGRAAVVSRAVTGDAGSLQRRWRVLGARSGLRGPGGRWRSSDYEVRNPAGAALFRARKPAEPRSEPHTAQTTLASGAKRFSFRSMTDKQAVLDALQRLPENVSLEEIAGELEIMASIRDARADCAAGRTKPQEDVVKLVESWAIAWNSR